MIFKKTAHGSVFIGENEYPSNLFRLHYGNDKVTIYPLIETPGLTTMVFDFNNIENAEGQKLTSKENIKNYLSTVFFTAASSGSGNTEAVNWDTLEGKPIIIASGATQAEARTSIGAGTSNLAIGTSATTAKAGNYQPTAANISDATTTGRSLITAADAAAARAAIGAGTGNSNLAIGTTGTTAAAGNHNHAVTADATSGLEAAATLQAAFIALSTRIKALEDATP